MLIVLKAIDAQGSPVASTPMTERAVIMKVWELKTTGCTQIRTFRANTNEEINIVRKDN